MKKLMAALLSLVIVQSALAQNAACDKLSESVNWDEKLVAYYDAQNKTALSTNTMARLNINAQIMLQQKCVFKNGPIDPAQYGYSAALCSIKMSTRRNPPECDLSTWVRGEGIQQTR